MGGGRYANSLVGSQSIVNLKMMSTNVNFDIGVLRSPSSVVIYM